MSRLSKIGSHATNVRAENGTTAVRFHNTDVIQFDSESITLDSGGWRTATTKTRINQASAVFELGIHVYQRDFRWYVTTESGDYRFYDGMRINRENGDVYKTVDGVTFNIRPIDSPTESDPFGNVCVDVDSPSDNVIRTIHDVPAGFVCVDVYSPATCPWDCYGRKHCQDIVASIKKIGNVDSAIWNHEHHRIKRVAHGTGPNGSVRFGDDMLPGVYRVYVHESDVEAAQKALSERELRINRWIQDDSEKPVDCFAD